MVWSRCELGRVEAASSSECFMQWQSKQVILGDIAGRTAGIGCGPYTGGDYRPDRRDVNRHFRYGGPSASNWRINWHCYGGALPSDQPAETNCSKWYQQRHQHQTPPGGNSHARAVRPSPRSMRPATGNAIRSGRGSRSIALPTNHRTAIGKHRRTGRQQSRPAQPVQQSQIPRQLRRKTRHRPRWRWRRGHGSTGCSCNVRSTFPRLHLAQRKR
jgi:hypothetical protein